MIDLDTIDGAIPYYGDWQKLYIADSELTVAFCDECGDKITSTTEEDLDLCSQCMHNQQCMAAAT